MVATKRSINQENWKRTQVRLPPDVHDELIAYAEQNNLSLNSAMIELMVKGLKIKEQGSSLGLGSYQGEGFGLPPYREGGISQLTDEIASKVVELLKNQKNS